MSLPLAYDSTNRAAQSLGVMLGFTNKSLSTKVGIPVRMMPHCVVDVIEGKGPVGTQKDTWHLGKEIFVGNTKRISKRRPHLYYLDMILPIVVVVKRLTAGLTIRLVSINVILAILIDFPRCPWGMCAVGVSNRVGPTSCRRLPTHPTAVDVARTTNFSPSRHRGSREFRHSGHAKRWNWNTLHTPLPRKISSSPGIG